MATRIPKPYRDPELDRVVDELRKINISVNSLAQNVGLSPSTLYNIDNGKTRHPQHYTLTRLWEGLGYEYKLVRKR